MLSCVDAGFAKVWAMVIVRLKIEKPKKGSAERKNDYKIELVVVWMLLLGLGSMYCFTMEAMFHGPNIQSEMRTLF